MSISTLEFVLNSKFKLYINIFLRGRVADCLWIGQSTLLIRHISVHDSFVDKKRFAQSTPMHRHSFEKVRLIYATNPLFSQTMDRVTGATWNALQVPQWRSGRPDFIKTDGPNFKTGGPSGYNWEIARVETENLWHFLVTSVDSLLTFEVDDYEFLPLSDIYKKHGKGIAR